MIYPIKNPDLCESATDVILNDVKDPLFSVGVAPRKH
jgi:hypothetical protein